MRFRNSIRKKLFILFTVIFISSIAIITLLNSISAKRIIINRLIDEEIPAQAHNIISDIREELLIPATGLQTVAKDPFFKEWIEKGEPESDLPKVIARLEATTNQFKTKGSNYVSWKTQKYYNFADKKFQPRMITEKDSWFPAFKESGREIGINVYTQHEEYGTVAFMNQRIDKKGEFLGLISCALELRDMVNRIVTHTIGKKGKTFLIDAKGNIKIHADQQIIADQKKIQDLTGYKEKYKELLNGKKYQFNYKKAGQTYLVYTRYIPELDWYLITEANSNELTKSLTNSVILSTIIALVLIIAGSILLYIKLQPVVQSLNDTVDAADQISKGNLSIKLHSTRSDEIGNLVTTMSKMIETLKTKEEVFKTISKGNLTHEITLASEEDTVGIAMQDMQHSLSDILRGVNRAVREVNVGADQISSLSQGLSQGATEQAASLEEITASLNEISHQAEQSNNAAISAEELAKSTSLKAHDGSDSMKNLNGLMNRIHLSSDKITKIIKVIDEIAFQINLLALNAAVEAARAGQHGKGFAVVADEVRNLANRSAKAVEETSVNVLETVEAINEGVTLAESTTEKFGAIVTEVKTIVENLSTISTLEEQQTNALHQITTGLQQIDSVTQNTAAGAEEGAASAEELASQTHILQSLIDQFTLLEDESDEYQEL